MNSEQVKVIVINILAIFSHISYANTLITSNELQYREVSYLMSLLLQRATKNKTKLST